MAAIYVPGGDPSRVYYGTDTHASALLIGAGLAFAWPLRQLRAAPREKAQRADLAGLTGIALLAWAMGHFPGGDSALYPAGLLIAAVGAGGLVVAAASSGVVSGMLSWAPLRWVGVRSYGIYLWHWPVIALLAAVTRPRPPGIWIRLAETAMAIGLAAASWRWIEEPIMRNGLGATVRAGTRRDPDRWPRGGLARPRLSRCRPSRGARGPCAAGYGVLRAPASAGLEQQITQGAKISAASRAHHVTSAAPRAPVVSPGTPGLCSNATAHPGQHTPRRRPRGPAEHRRVQGHRHRASVMLAAAGQLQAALKGIYIDAAISRMSAGLAIVQGLADTARSVPW